MARKSMVSKPRAKRVSKAEARFNRLYEQSDRGVNSASSGPSTVAPKPSNRDDAYISALLKPVSDPDPEMKAWKSTAKAGNIDRVLEQHKAGHVKLDDTTVKQLKTQADQLRGKSSGSRAIRMKDLAAKDASMPDMGHLARENKIPADPSNLKREMFTLKAYQEAKRQGGVPAVRELQKQHAEYKRQLKLKGGDPYGQQSEAYRAEAHAAGVPSGVTSAQRRLQEGGTKRREMVLEKIKKRGDFSPVSRADQAITLRQMERSAQRDATFFTNHPELRPGTVGGALAEQKVANKKKEAAAYRAKRIENINAHRAATGRGSLQPRVPAGSPAGGQFAKK